MVESLKAHAHMVLKLTPQPIDPSTGNAGFQQELVRRVGNTLAWYEASGAKDLDGLHAALAIIERSAKYIDNPAHYYVYVTQVNILYSLAQADAAFQIVKRVMASQPEFGGFANIVASDVYRSWLSDNS